MKSEFQTKLIAGMRKRAGEGSDAIHQRLREYERLKIEGSRQEQTQKEQDEDRRQKALDDQERRQREGVELKRKEEAYQKEQEALQAAEEEPRLPGSDPDTQKLQNAQASALGRAQGSGTPRYVKGFTLQKNVPNVKTANRGKILWEGTKNFVKWLGRGGDTASYKVLDEHGLPKLRARGRTHPGEKVEVTMDYKPKDIAQRWAWTGAAPLFTDAITYGVNRGVHGDTKPYMPFGIGQGEGPGRMVNATLSALMARIAHGKKFSQPSQSSQWLLGIPGKELAFQGVWGIPKFLNNQAEGNLATNRLADATQAVADKGTSVTVNQDSAPSGDSMPWWVLPATGAAILGTGALGVMGMRAMRPHGNDPGEGTIQVHLPAPEPGLADTTVSLPSSEFNISKTMRGQLARDVRRRLRKGTETRTHRRPKPEDEEEDEKEDEEDEVVVDFPKAASETKPPKLTLDQARAKSPQAERAFLKEEGKRLDTTPLLSFANLGGLYAQLQPHLQAGGVNLPMFGTPSQRYAKTQTPVAGAPANAWVQRRWPTALRNFQGTGDNTVRGATTLNA